ncbi:MAG: DUF4870 domain-containing protein [Candidatus Micrarchaeia archaeon]
MLSPSKKDSPVLAALAYGLGTVIAVIIYLVGKEDKWVKFNALQALLFDLAFGIVFIGFFIVAWVLTIVTFGIGAICIIPLILLVPLVLIIRLWLAYRAFKGEYFELPAIGQFALKYV